MDMKIKVKGYLTFRKTIGDLVLTLDEDEKLTLNELLLKFSREQTQEDAFYQGDPDILDGRVIVLVNGKHFGQLPKKLDTILKDKDDIAIFPPMAGG